MYAVYKELLNKPRNKHPKYMMTDVTHNGNTIYLT